MKYWMGGIFAVVCAFFLADFLFCQKATPVRVGADTSGPSSIAFFHALHGDSIGLACTACHTGAASRARAYMPAKADCMDCHRLPLTENPGIEKLDSALAAAPAYPWVHTPELPEHVVFHHRIAGARGVPPRGTRGRRSRVCGLPPRFCGRLFPEGKGRRVRRRQFQHADVHRLPQGRYVQTKEFQTCGNLLRRVPQVVYG